MLACVVSMTVDYLQRLFVLYELMRVTCTVGGHGCGGWGLLCGASLFQDLGCCQEHIPTGTVTCMYVHVHVARLYGSSTSMLVPKRFLWMVLQAFDQFKHLCCLQIKLQSHQSLAFNGLTLHDTISTTVQCHDKIFLYCSEDCKAADINCLVF